MNQIILYGAGVNGKKDYKFLKARGMDKLVYAFCDRNYENIEKIDNVPVKSYEEVKQLDIPIIITVGNNDVKKEIIAKLKNDNKTFYSDFLEWINSYFEDPVERDRNIIAYYHVENSYYKDVDNEDDLNIFWGDNSPFYEMFKQLDMTNVIELACGEGRHVRKYLEEVGHVTLVDILQSNLDVCKERYKGIDKISYYRNNGYDLKDLEEGTYSSLFTYDAMVHFEMLDIYNYLKDIYRVLVPGGRALFHHSNFGGDYKNNFLSNKHCRNFMSKEIFANLAYKCGFKIIHQQIINWGRGEDLVESLDCITLLEKSE